MITEQRIEEISTSYINWAKLNQHDKTEGFLKCFKLGSADYNSYPELKERGVVKVGVNPSNTVIFIDNNGENVDLLKQSEQQEDLRVPFQRTTQNKIVADELPEEPEGYDDIQDDDDDNDDLEGLDHNRAQTTGSEFYIPTNLPNGTNHPAYAPLKIISDKLKAIDWNAELNAYNGELNIGRAQAASLLQQAVMKVRASLWTEIAGNAAPTL